MRSFGISLFTTLACALFAGAAPVDVLPRGDISLNTNSAPSGNAAANTNSTPAGKGNADADVDPDLHTIPDVLNYVKIQIGGVKGEIDAIVGTKVGGVVDEVKPKLEQAQAILATAVATVKVIVANPQGSALTLGGKVIALVDVAHLVADVVSVYAYILFKAWQLAGPGIQYLISAIAWLLVTLLTLIFWAISTLVAEVTPLIDGVTITILHELNLVKVLVVLGIQA